MLFLTIPTIIFPAKVEKSRFFRWKNIYFRMHQFQHFHNIEFCLFSSFLFWARVNSVLCFLCRLRQMVRRYEFIDLKEDNLLLIILVLRISTASVYKSSNCSISKLLKNFVYSQNHGVSLSKIINIGGVYSLWTWDFVCLLFI